MLSRHSLTRSGATSSSDSAAAPRLSVRLPGISGVSKPTISRHLKMLEEAGVVTRVIDGRTHRLALRPETLADASDWIDIQRARWERLFDVVDEYLEERKE